MDSTFLVLMEVVKFKATDKEKKEVKALKRLDRLGPAVQTSVKDDNFNTTFTGVIII